MLLNLGGVELTFSGMGRRLKTRFQSLQCRV